MLLLHCMVTASKDWKDCHDKFPLNIKVQLMIFQCILCRICCRNIQLIIGMCKGVHTVHLKIQEVIFSSLFDPK